MRLARGEEGYEVGAYMFNIVAAELIFAAIFLAILASTWPTPPWDRLLYGGVLLMVTVPFFFYPFSKTIFLAFDLTFRPPMPEDFE
jgi:ABC-type dipeptide/oligopeptide/nickel transport system permease component